MTGFQANAEAARSLWRLHATASLPQRALYGHELMVFRRATARS